MAEPMKKAGRIKRLVLGLSLVLSAMTAQAGTENLPDPTRPPNTLTVGDAEPAPSGPELQSILVASNRRVAVINGQTVQVGDKVGDAKVFKISETEVVLKNDKEVRVLKLFPEIEKRQPSGNMRDKAGSRR